MPKHHLYTEDIAKARLANIKLQREGIVRPISQIRRALRMRQPITQRERDVLAAEYEAKPPLPEGSEQAIKDGVSFRAPYEPKPYDANGEAADETVTCPNCGKKDAPDAKFCDQCGFKLEGAEGVKTRDDGGTAVIEADTAEANETADEVADSQASAKTDQASVEAKGIEKPQELHGAAAEAVKDPEGAAMELAPPGPDHEAFTGHDEAMAASQKAIVSMERANGPADKQEAVHGVFDAAKAHKGVARQFDALADHLMQHGLVGAPKARAAAKAHHDAAAALTKAATTGLGVHYRKAHSIVSSIEPKTKELSSTLSAQAKKHAEKAQKAKKAQIGGGEVGTAARLDRRLAKRG